MQTPLKSDEIQNSTLADRVNDSIRTLTPGYFALVMASGIISIGALDLGFTTISTALAFIAGGAWVLLVVLNVIRFIRFRSEVAEDFQDPSRAFGFFTWVAATCVLGSRIAAEGELQVSFVLLVIGSLIWLAFGYIIPWTAVLGRTVRPVIQTANGTWFIWVVASQSITVLSATLEVYLDDFRRELAILAVFSWSVGVFLYAAAGVFVAARMMLYELDPHTLTPPYWVAMGATAITVVGGARIVQMADAPMVDATRGLIAGASVLFWAFGTWLIPPLIAAGYWRHIKHKIPVRYEATWWSIIFPLGMYGVGSSFLGEADSLPILSAIGGFQFWIALTAWTITATAMCLNFYRTVMLPPRPEPDRG